MSISRRLLPGLTLILAVGACEGDMVDPDNELTMEESVALMQAAGAILADTTLVPIGGEPPDSIVFACPQGGQVTLVGGFTEETGDTARLGADFEITPAACVVTGGGLQFTVDGNPHLDYVLTIEIVAATFEFNISGTIVGSLNWKLGERSGDCDIDLTLEAVPDLSDPSNPGLSGTYTGTLCGHEVEIDAAELAVGL